MRENSQSIAPNPRREGQHHIPFLALANGDHIGRNINRPRACKQGRVGKIQRGTIANRIFRGRIENLQVLGHARSSQPYPKLV